MSETGITAFGAYVPWRRFERQAMARNTAWYNQEVAAARGERAWCGWDEDVFTMAVEAVRDCLPAQAARERLSAVLLATTTAPFADRSGAAIVREAAGLPAGALCLDVGGSYRAGTSALLSALRLASGEDAPVLCVAAEQVTSAPASTEELQSGDAAAAFVTGTRDVIAEYLGGHSTAADFVDHFRPRDSMHNYFWETRWARDEGVLSLVRPRSGRPCEPVVSMPPTSTGSSCRCPSRTRRRPPRNGSASRSSRSTPGWPAGSATRAQRQPSWTWPQRWRTCRKDTLSLSRPSAPAATFSSCAARESGLRRQAVGCRDGWHDGPSTTRT